MDYLETGIFLEFHSSKMLVLIDRRVCKYEEPVRRKKEYVHPLTFMGLSSRILFAVQRNGLAYQLVLQHSGYLYGQSW